jgi:hypothetical protein
MNRLFSWILFLMAISALIANYYFFYNKKEYDFLVEAPCDPNQNPCFLRDCSDDGCPPNNLSKYRIFHMSGSDFEKCVDDSCLYECETNKISCTEQICNSELDEVCSAL